MQPLLCVHPPTLPTLFQTLQRIVHRLSSNVKKRQDYLNICVIINRWRSFQWLLILVYCHGWNYECHWFRIVYFERLIHMERFKLSDFPKPNQIILPSWQSSPFVTSVYKQVAICGHPLNSWGWRFKKPLFCSSSE